MKLSNFTIPDSNKDEIFITKFTKLTPLKVDFAYQDHLTVSSSDTIINLSSISRLAPEQLVAVKCQVVSISGVKLVPSRFQYNLKKQGLLIRDTTACMQVVLLDTHVDCVELNKTHLFQSSLKIQI